MESCSITVLCAHQGAAWPARPVPPGAPKMLGLGDAGQWRSPPDSDKAGMEAARCHCQGCSRSIRASWEWYSEDVLAMLQLPGMPPGCWRVATLGMAHQAGCSLLPIHALGLPVVFWPHGESVVDPNPYGLPWGKAAVPAASSLSCLPPRLQHPSHRKTWGREHGASRKTIFAILQLKGQPVFLSSRPSDSPRQKIKVLWEVSKLESHPFPPVPGGRSSGCGLDSISGRKLQPAPP